MGKMSKVGALGRERHGETHARIAVVGHALVVLRLALLGDHPLPPALPLMSASFSPSIGSRPFVPSISQSASAASRTFTGTLLGGGCKGALSGGLSFTLLRSPSGGYWRLKGLLGADEEAPRAHTRDSLMQSCARRAQGAKAPRAHTAGLLGAPLALNEGEGEVP